MLIAARGDGLALNRLGDMCTDGRGWKTAGLGIFDLHHGFRRAIRP
ncbi:hypothetical protein [Duganella sp. HH101]|nr:hypothetical protein [Duganella sp. HH101]OFA06717.1 hypothetical protein DUGA2_00450 [Duganella sp. HH101]